MFNDNQPRDYHGRWTDTLNGSSMPSYIMDKIKGNNSDEILQEKINKAKDEKKDSLTMYLDANGHLSAERKALHDKIVNDLLANGSTRDGIVYFMGGAPANGKSSLVKSGKLDHPNGIIHLDVDMIKSKLPEYNLMVKGKDPYAAAFSHEESSMIGKKVTAEALKRHYDYVMDGVGNSGIESIDKKVSLIRSAGKKAVADYVTLDTDKSIFLNRKRYNDQKGGGRLVPEAYVKAMNKEISLIVPKMLSRNTYDELRLWDTNIEGQPVLILHHKNGKTVIHNQALYNKFLNKAK